MCRQEDRQRERAETERKRGCAPAVRSEGGADPVVALAVVVQERGYFLE